MALNEQQEKFIDAFLETLSPESSACIAGYPKSQARTIAYDLLANDEIKQRIDEREKQFKKIADLQKMDKDRLLRAMYYQYGKANSLNKTIEATSILEKIAKFCGIDPEKVKITPPNIVINNLDETKI